jgi:alkyldihydroxyacetonephosphate synthase
MLVVIFEGTEDCPQRGVEEARRIAESARGSWEGDAPARRWLQHRYSVSYRQAPVFANGAFVDTMEVAARWSQLGTLFESVRRALAEHVFVMAHLSHAYPDGCCIYFSFVGAADPPSVRELGWDAACSTTYDRAWKAALAAAVDAGGTLSHHHGVGRSKAPRLRSELGAGTDVVRSLMRAFDPAGVLNPGNLVDPRTPTPTPTSTPTSTPTPTPIVIDRESLLVCAAGAMDVATLERQLNDSGLTLDATFPPEVGTVDDWLSRGAPGSRDRWQDPADQTVAGLDATLAGGRVLHIRPAPRRAVGPDLSALFVGAGGRFGRIDRAWLRVHPRGVVRPTSTPFEHDRDPLPGDGERALLDAIERSLA